MLLVRGCGVSEDRYDGETDKCRSGETWGTEVTECVCEEDDCNGTTRSQAPVVVLVLVVATGIKRLVYV